MALFLPFPNSVQDHDGGDFRPPAGGIRLRAGQRPGGLAHLPVAAGGHQEQDLPVPVGRLG